MDKSGREIYKYYILFQETRRFQMFVAGESHVSVSFTDTFLF